MQSELVKIMKIGVCNHFSFVGILVPTPKHRKGKYKKTKQKNYKEKSTNQTIQHSYRILQVEN